MSDQGPGRRGGYAGRTYEQVELEPVSRAGAGRRPDRPAAARPLPVRPPAIGAKGGPKRELHDPDWVIVVAVVALGAVGILMVYSASAIPSYAASQNTFEMVAPQIGAGLAGLVTMILLARLDYRYLRKVSLVLAIVALVLLVAVLIPRIGVSANGASRWIKLGPLFEVHPSEVAKLAMVVYLAHWLATRGTQIRSFFHGTVPFWIIVVPFVVLVAREPDLGTTAIIVLIALTLFFVAGCNLLHLGMALAGGMAGGAALVLAIGTYPMQRIQVFLDPWSDPAGAGYHTITALEALGAGGILGTGLGNDKVLVPNDFNDFIFSVIAQELGFVGGVVVICLFVAFAWAGIRTALRAPDTFGGLLAAGITAWIVFQAFVNICVVLALVPVTGITLPFVSQGGSSLVVSFAAAGILLSVSRETVERGWVSASVDRGRGYGRTHIPGSRRGTIAADSTGGT
ncbi:MAG: putative lipid II flippase FtsW [Candidatus Limnocylindrales bacterium]|jgi:cell division protein FtsW